MKKPIRFVRLVGCLVMVLFLLTPASFADTEDPINHWMDTIEKSFLNQAYIDMDGAYNGQCVDLAFFYAAEIFPETNFRSSIGLGNANQLHYGASSDYFKQIPFEGQKPRPGDIVTWDHYANGHVGIVFQVSDNSFKMYHQNTNFIGTSPVEVMEIFGPDYGLPYLSAQPIGYLRPIMPEAKVSPELPKTEEQN